MSKEVVSIYGDFAIESPYNSGRLIIEISNYHITCVVKKSMSAEVSALEVYNFNSYEETWYNIFQDVRLKSKILTRGFLDTHVYFNLPETVLIPYDFYNEAVAKQYLQLIHGDFINQVIVSETVGVTPAIVVSSKVKRGLMDAINSNLIMITMHNSYSVFIENLLNPTRTTNHSLLKAQLYNNEILIGVVHNSQLLIVQLYEQHTSDDILYHLLNVLHQHNLKTEEITLELSGDVELDTTLYDNLRKFFHRITFDTPSEDLIKLHDFTKYPKHYLTPFLNLT
jgi:hypothetical protein